MSNTYNQDTYDFTQKYGHEPVVIDINVQDPRIMHKTVMEKYVILNYNLNYLQSATETPNVVSSGLHQNTESEFMKTQLLDKGVDNPNNYYSIIANTQTKRALSIAPSVPIPLDDFIQQFPFGTEDIQITQMTEGTMVQLFYDSTEYEWQIATRRFIGGTNYHYRTEYPGYTFQPQKTFREMFYDALTQVTNAPKIIQETDPDGIVCGLNYNPHETYYNTPLSSIPYIKTLDKSCCYSYIITHSSNPLTNVVFIPTITLIAVCEIIDYGIGTGKQIAYTIPQSVFAERIPKEYRKIVRVQSIIDWSGKSLRDETLNYMFMNDNHPGLMLTNTKTGERAVLENISYREVMKLRGNHKNLQYQFFEIYLSKRLDKFLSRFPVFNKLFLRFFDQYYDFTFRVYSTYVQYYIHKNREGVNYEFHKHASKIHSDIYLPSVDFDDYVYTHYRDIYVPDRIKTKITRQIVQEYFDKMTPSQLYHIVTTTMVDIV